jgi:hypothetical protein
MNDMPPKPPLVSPWLYSTNALLGYAANPVGVAINAYLAYSNRAIDWLLFFNCTGLSLALCASYMMVRNVGRIIRDHRKLRRMWDEAFRQREQGE